MGMKTKRRSWLTAGPLLLLVASLAAPVLGQSVTGTVTGAVTDNTGAAVKGVSVVAENGKTGVQYPTKSNDVGVYTSSGLPAGDYQVRAEAQGFKTVVTNPLTLEV